MLYALAQSIWKIATWEFQRAFDSYRSFSKLRFLSETSKASKIDFFSIFQIKTVEDKINKNVFPTNT